MKIPDFAVNDKRRLIKKPLLSLVNQDFTNDISSEGRELPAGVVVNFDSIAKLLTNSPTKPSIKLQDRIGRIHAHDFEGNICVFGDDMGRVAQFSNELRFKLGFHGHEVNIIDAEQASTTLLKNSDIPLLIQVFKPISKHLITLIVKNCSTICVTRSKESEIICSLNSTVRSSFYMDRLINAFGGDYHLRELMIASLGGDEFLLIENNRIGKERKASVRCFLDRQDPFAELLNFVGE